MIKSGESATTNVMVDHQRQSMRLAANAQVKKVNRQQPDKKQQGRSQAAIPKRKTQMKAEEKSAAKGARLAAQQAGSDATMKRDSDDSGNEVLVPSAQN